MTPPAERRVVQVAGVWPTRHEAALIVKNGRQLEALTAKAS
jgi:hypothetical protein